MGSLLEYAITGPCRFRGKYESTGLGQGCGVGLLTVTQCRPTSSVHSKGQSPFSKQGRWRRGDGCLLPPLPHRPCPPRGPHALQ